MKVQALYTKAAGGFNRGTVNWFIKRYPYPHNYCCNHNLLKSPLTPCFYNMYKCVDIQATTFFVGLQVTFALSDFSFFHRISIVYEDLWWWHKVCSDWGSSWSKPNAFIDLLSIMFRPSTEPYSERAIHPNEIRFARGGNPMGGKLIKRDGLKDEQ